MKVDEKDIKVIASRRIDRQSDYLFYKVLGFGMIPSIFMMFILSIYDNNIIKIFSTLFYAIYAAELWGVAMSDNKNYIKLKKRLMEEEGLSDTKTSKTA